MSDYSSCTVSCGGGRKTRTRVCETANTVDCIGLDTQAATCNTTSCPPEVTYGTWATWLGWGECSTTCGGGSKARSRECVKAAESDVDCVGNLTQSKGCNTHDCPDCSRTCTEGSLNDQCTLCVCATTFTGQIFGKGQITLGNVTISPYNSPSDVLVTTLNDGKFTLENQCLQNQYIFLKSGYISLSVDGVSMSQKHTLEKIEPLLIVQNPQKKMRLEGESLTICCEATGHPLPENYEWLKNGEVIMTLDGPGPSELILSDVTISDSGTYQCRANNDYTAIKSSEVPIIVKSSVNEFCDTSPHSKVRRLPEGCSLNGDDVYDEGFCPPSPCRGSVADSGQCSETAKYCCGPVSYSRLDIPCVGNITIPLLYVTACGCTECTQSVLIVSGVALGTDGGPLFWGDILYNGTVIGSTSTTGSFSVEIPSGIERVPLVFKDSVFKKYLDTIYVVRVNDGRTAVNIYITVKMIAAMSEAIDATANSDITLVSSGTGTNLANLSIPRDSFYDMDGNLYEGQVQASIGVIDQNNLQDFAASPGDFTSVNEEGDSQQLDSFGMIAVQFKDASGNPLLVPGDIELYISEAQIGNTTDTNGFLSIKLWQFNPVSGNWEFESEIEEIAQSQRRKRQVDESSRGQRSFQTTIRGLSVDTLWYNFDAIRQYMCYTKIRVYTDYTLTEEIDDASLSVVVQGAANYNSLSTFRARTDSNNNGYCIAHPCDNSERIDAGSEQGFKAYYFGELEGRKLFPVELDNAKYADHKNTLSDYWYTLEGDQLIKLNKVVYKKDGGPFYDWEDEKNWRDSPSCSSADPNDAHLIFYDRFCEYKITPYKPKIDTQNLGACYEENYLAWHTPARSNDLDNPRVCFVKINIETESTQKAVFRAVSDVPVGKQKTTIGTNYGLRDSCNEKINSAICLEFKDPSKISCDYFNGEETEVSVLIQSVKGARYNVTEISAALTDDFPSSVTNKGSSVAINVQFDAYGERYGIYCDESTGISEAFNSAEKKCYSGTDSSSDAITDTHYAVKFKDLCSFKLDIIFVVDTSTSMTSYFDDVKSMIKKISNDAPITQNLYRIALLTTDSGQRISWNLDSTTAYTVSSINSLVDALQISSSIVTPAVAFSDVRTQILGGSADRADADNVIIFISDGSETTAELDSEIAALTSPTSIIAVGTTDAAKTALASHFPKQLILSSTSADLLLDLEEQVCG